jgi:hypothetical protein
VYAKAFCRFHLQLINQLQHEPASLRSQWNGEQNAQVSVTVKVKLLFKRPEKTIEGEVQISSYAAKFSFLTFPLLSPRFGIRS